jgi:hypothetical protein
MSEYQLTPKQIQLCNYLLSINHIIIDRDKLKIDGHDESDIFNVQKFLLDKNLITNANPIRLTDKGIKYSKTGIVKFFKDQRRDEFLNSAIVRTFAVWTGIIISLSIGVSNCRQNQINNSDKIKYIKQSEIDSILNKKLLENTDSPKDKFTIKKVEKTSFKHIE